MAKINKSMTITLSIPSASQSYDFFDDKVQLENHNCKTIFGKNYKTSGYAPWKRGVVKIRYNGTNIRRIFYSGNSNGIKIDSLGLSIISMQILNVQPNTQYDIKLSKGNRFLFMWHHPNPLTRIGFKYTFVLGSLSIAIASLPYLFRIL